MSSYIKPNLLIEVSNPYDFILDRSKIISTNSGTPKPLVDLSFYASKNIPTNYKAITELPQEHIEYLNSVRGTNMTGMFYMCLKLTSLDASKWDTSKVTTMSSMFLRCESLISLDVSKLDTSNVTSMYQMFSSCYVLTSLDLSNWNTSNATDMSRMFNACLRLTSLDLSNWDTSKVTNMGGMFKDCRILTTITGTIDMSSCTICTEIFYGCINLKGVHLKNVPRSLNLSDIGGTEGETYIIDNYLEDTQNVLYIYEENPEPTSNNNILNITPNIATLEESLPNIEDNSKTYSKVLSFNKDATNSHISTDLSYFTSKYTSWYLLASNNTPVDIATLDTNTAILSGSMDEISKLLEYPIDNNYTLYFK